MCEKGTDGVAFRASHHIKGCLWPGCARLPIKGLRAIRDEVAELVEVAHVGPQGVRGKVALHPQMVHEHEYING